jgi:hypothetical protein
MPLYGPSNPTLEMYPKEMIQHVEEKRYLHPHIPCRTVYNSQEMELTYMTFNGKMGK